MLWLLNLVLRMLHFSPTSCASEQPRRDGQGARAQSLNMRLTPLVTTEMPLGTHVANGQHKVPITEQRIHTQSRLQELLPSRRDLRKTRNTGAPWVTGHSARLLQSGK